MFWALADMLIKQADVDEYVTHRERDISPAMAATGAFIGTHFLRSTQPADDEGNVRWLLMNMWNDLEVQRRFAASSSHAAQLNEMKTLMRITSVRSVKNLEDVSYVRRDRAPTRTFVFESHRCHPGRGADYLAALADVRKNVDDFPECAGIMVNVDVDNSDSFVVAYRWNSESSDAGAQAAQADLEGTVAQLVQDTVADGLGATTRYSELYRWRHDKDHGVQRVLPKAT